ncbi:MAG: hypothetical protein A3H92_04190 [Rhodospirillales bacterium RIFCSPLOWO2_02_FULL_58_16]|nr:MAG: hypothetical protein A3H92_04190 [Rhodospirillales bacterium RIFCSPLOWO2_02_FULL_58_16]
MTDWPLLIFLGCGGALIMFIGLMNIVDLDSFFAALAAAIDMATALPDMLLDGVNGLLQNFGLMEAAPDIQEAPPVEEMQKAPASASQGKPPVVKFDEEGMIVEEVK